MKFIGYKCEFNGKINETQILINEKSNREIPAFFKISRDTFRTKKKPGSRELNPSQDATVHVLLKSTSITILLIIFRLFSSQMDLNLVQKQTLASHNLFEGQQKPQSISLLREIVYA